MGHAAAGRLAAAPGLPTSQLHVNGVQFAIPVG
jgi:hypothetical protein